MRRVAALCTALFLLPGCELLAGLQNRKVLGAVVLSTPEVAPTQAPGFPQGFPALAADVTAEVFFGERHDDLMSGGSSSQAPTGIAGAAVSVSWRDGTGVLQTVSLAPASEPGHYRAAAADGLAYVAGATYRFTLEQGADTYTAAVTAPAAARVATFPADGLLVQDSYADFDALTLEFARESAEGLAFYGVYRVDPASTSSTLDDVTCTNLAVTSTTDPANLVDFVLDATPWQKDSYTLRKTSSVAEESCFPTGPSGTSPAGYVVGLGAGRKGTVSDNLFVGSVVFAGTVEGGAVVFPQ